MTDFLSIIQRVGRELNNHELTTINLIASDNARRAPKFWAANYDGNIIQEGLVLDRPFAGASLHDELEELVAKKASRIFGLPHANLQPHSCSQANQAVLHGLTNPGDKVLSLSFRSGGHLTHGLKVNFSGRWCNFEHFDISGDGIIDYKELMVTAKNISPKVIMVGSSAYPGLFDGKKLRHIADESGAILVLDLSHEAGLIAGKAITNPIPYCDVATASLDKTLRGPFGGMILCKRELAELVDKAVHPGTQSSFPIRKLMEIAVALEDVESNEFKKYAKSVVQNSINLYRVLNESGIRLIGGLPEKHYFLIGELPNSMSGVEAEKLLEDHGILSSRQTLYFQNTNRMCDAMGLRIGTPWITSRGYENSDIEKLGVILSELLNRGASSSMKNEVSRLANLYREKDIWNWRKTYVQ